MAMGIADETTDPKAATEALIATIRQMNADMCIPTKLQGLRECDIPKLAKLASTEANPLYPVPALMTAKELEQFYYNVMEERT